MVVLYAVVSSAAHTSKCSFESVLIKKFSILRDDDADDILDLCPLVSCDV